MGIEGGEGVVDITPGLELWHLVIWGCHYWFGAHWVRNKCLWAGGKWVESKSLEVNGWPIKPALVCEDIRMTIMYVQRMWWK